MTASIALTTVFALFALVMAGLFAARTGRWAVVVAWLVLTAGLGVSGVLDDFGLPPRPLLLFLPALLGALAWGWRGTLHVLPLRLLVGFQAFRIGVELLIHQAVVEGVAPPQMSWEGMNQDIVTGVTALLLFPFAERVPKAVLHAWNAMGAALLLKVVVVAILSMPTPLQRIEPDNTWIAHWPWIWLPTVHVLLATMGHVALLRKLVQRPAG